MEATADVEVEAMLLRRLSVGGAGFRGRLLGINPAVWAAGGLFGSACVRAAGGVSALSDHVAI